MTLLYSDPLFLEHVTPPYHPEHANRLQTIVKRLLDDHLFAQCKPGAYKPVTPEQVLRLHSNEQLQLIQSLTEEGGGHIDGDTVVSPKSYEVALAAAGVGVSAVDAVLRGDDRNALGLVRPPGHHATPARSMGFCLFNSIALAADHARVNHELSRILIVDWDVHHGNGTQDIFFEDGEVMVLNIHRYGGGFYPGTGAAHETGEGAGKGWNINVTLPFGISQKEYHDAFQRGLDDALKRCKPEIVLISAGFDAHALDPIGSLGLEVEDFTELTRRVIEVADAHCQGRVVSLLEGGYNVNALAECVETHLRELLESSAS